MCRSRILIKGFCFLESSVFPGHLKRHARVGWAFLVVDPASLQPTSGGYLAGKVTACDDTEMEDPAGRPEASASYDHDGDHQVPSTAAPLKVVSVVGLAHANGILDRCAGQGLRDETALARAALETAEWVGY